MLRSKIERFGNFRDRPLASKKVIIMIGRLIRNTVLRPVEWQKASLVRSFARTTMNVDKYTKYLKRRKNEESGSYLDCSTSTKTTNHAKLLREEAAALNIPKTMYELTFARSQGPGGQNVNKVNSKAILRINIQSMEVFGKGTAERFRMLFKNMVTKEDDVIVSAQESRDQERNVDLAFQKMKMMIAEAKVAPSEHLVDFYEEHEESKKKRVDEKRRRSEIKGDRNKWD